MTKRRRTNNQSVTDQQNNQIDKQVKSNQPTPKTKTSSTQGSQLDSQQQKEEEEEEKTSRIHSDDEYYKSDSTQDSSSSSGTKKKKKNTTHQNRTKKETKHKNKNQVFKLFLNLIKCLIWPIKSTIEIVLPQTILGILILLVTIMTIYLLIIWFRQFLENMLFSSSISMISVPLRALSGPVIYVYCSMLRGPFCGKKEAEINMGQVARTVTGTAQQASDIFDSVIQLSDPSHLGLHQTEILELAFAVRWSSNLRDKSALADGLNDLSDLTRQLKDHLVDLNGIGLNAFSFIAFQFERLGDLIEWVQTGKKAYTTETIKQNVDILYEDLSRELSKLIAIIENLIPIASRSTNLGIQISEHLHRQHYNLINEKLNQSLWKKVLDLTKFHDFQINNDILLTTESIKNLKSTWIQLENIRSGLLSYRNNVANFKASFIGWHLADHGLSPEDELMSMRNVIEKFQFTIKSVKSAGSHLPSSFNNHLLSSPSSSKSTSHSV